MDLVDKTELSTLETKIKAINASADIYITSKAIVPMDFYLDLDCFSSGKSIKASTHSHNSSLVQTIAINLDSSHHISLEKLESWLQMVLWERNQAALQSMVTGSFDLQAALVEPSKSDFLVMRLKALVNIRGFERKLVIQGVYDMFDKHEGEVWGDSEERASRVVVIGYSLDRELLEASFRKHCVQ